MAKCPVCAETFKKHDIDSLAKHFQMLNDRNDAFHVGWLREYVPMDNYNGAGFSKNLAAFFSIPDGDVKTWMEKKFIDRFLGDKPHPFIDAMQRPKKSLFLGFAAEYYFFLKQKIKSCSYVIAKTDKIEIQRFEGKVIMPELINPDGSNTSQMTLLIRMSESLGVSKDVIVNGVALPPTIHSIKLWNQISETDHWLEIMAAVNALDMLNSKAMRDRGAKFDLYNKGVLDNEWIPDQVKVFLNFVVNPANDTSQESLTLISKYAKELDMTEDVQSTFLRSLDAFDRHLQARLTRAKQFEGSK
ncbi:MAG: hypothetical protein M1410_06960 [Candidatus Thermoplasmatota archaeon]|nr:hypothetical protein [Candidatus Thermoplasmatota archaeon]